ncbi:hypothetical protein L1987_08086 [Smallanthus sonchifolius]|uniref:Uncharacterized protein n=1 Tax=Smallanthus sonchifolius TaxID=185202 RepID=A0ACB9JJ64_9ASTR|nr:hypothetical protein L1987_08086 [Smallanthus sonchifolius]
MCTDIDLKCRVVTTEVTSSVTATKAPSAVVIEPTDEELTALKKSKGKIPVSEEEAETHGKYPAAISSDPNRIIPGAQMPMGMADKITQRFHEEELKDAEEEES